MNRKQKLKKEIEKARPSIYYLFEREAIENALQNPSILRYCDPIVMKKAGWISIENNFINVCPYCLNENCESDHKL